MYRIPLGVIVRGNWSCASDFGPIGSWCLIRVYIMVIYYAVT